MYMTFFSHIYIYIYICRVSRNNRQIFHGQIEQTKLSRKVLYHFLNSLIVNEILILKDNRIACSPGLLLQVYMPSDCLAREPWQLEIGWQVPRAAHTTSLHSSDGALVRLSPLPTVRVLSNR